MKNHSTLCLFLLLLLIVSCTQTPTIKPLDKSVQKNGQDHVHISKQASIPEISNKTTAKQSSEKPKALKPKALKPKASVVTIDSEGRLIVNGKPFFVIGLYSVPQKSLAEAKKLGFNSAHTYRGEGSKSRFRPKGRAREMLSYLKAADKEDLMVWMGLPRYEITHNYTPVIERLIDTLKLSPALMAWYIYDEPDIDNIPLYKIEYVAQMLQQQDPFHPKLLALSGDSKTFVHIPDIIITDYYPIGRSNPDISGVTQRIESVLINKKPVWNVVQMHGKGEGGPGYGYKEPSYKQLRNMTFQSIIAGAKGLLFFTYSGSQFKLYKSSKGLKNIKKITTELKKLTPILLSDNVFDNTIKTNKNSSIKTRVFKYQQKTYLFLVNTSRKDEMLKVSFNKKSNNKVSVFPDKRIIKLKKKSFSESIEPLGVRIYQFE